MHQSPIWVVKDTVDFREMNKKAFVGREVMRQKVEEDRRRRIVEGRERRGVAAEGSSTQPNVRRRKYEAVKPPQRQEEGTQQQEGEQEGSRQEPGTVISLAELLAHLEDSDHIDGDEDVALNAALATRNVEAVLAFSATLMTPQMTGRNAAPLGPNQPIPQDLEAQHQAADAEIEAIDAEKRDSVTWGADNDDTDTQNEHWRKVQVRTPVDVPLDLLPGTQRLETLQVQEDMKIFSDETKDVPPPKRVLRSAWWLPTSKWRVMDPDQPSTLQNPNHDRDFSAEGFTYLPMGQELLSNGVCYDKLAEDDREMVKNEKDIANSTVGKRYKEYLLAEGFLDGKHLPHYLQSCKVPGEDYGRGVQRASNDSHSNRFKAEKHARGKTRDTMPAGTEKLPDIKTPRV